MGNSLLVCDYNRKGRVEKDSTLPFFLLFLLRKFPRNRPFFPAGFPEVRKLFHRSWHALTFASVTSKGLGN